MTCRDEILDTVQQIINEKGVNEFTIPEVIHHMVNTGTQFKENTIRTHIASRLCVNAPDNHAVTYADFERIGNSTYKLL